MPQTVVGNLPAEVTSFVGRRQELAAAKRALSTSRVVTLSGPGGVGKTRLARRVAAQVHRAFTDGIWFTGLADLQRGDLVAQAVAVELGLRLESSDPVAVLADYLRNKTLLLVLDNCEHIVEECADLVSKIVSVAAGVRVLATSREVLGIEGEHVLDVPPLRVPSEDYSGLAAPSDAVTLFTERASAATRFELNDQNCSLVVHLCQRLDGIPLALELAAVRLRTVPLAELVRRLDNAPALLTRGSRTAPQRQQTLQAAIEWSYNLCSAHEQLLWRRLSVFAGGFTLDAAEQVCAGSPIEKHEILDLLSSLVDKSVVSRTGNQESAPSRYSLLEVLRQYGLARLVEGGEEHSARLRHRDFFALLLQRGATEYVSSRDVNWFRDVDIELANARAALGFSLREPDQADRTTEMVTGVHHYWTHTAGTTREGYGWLISALERYSEPTHVRIRALNAACKLASLLGEIESASRLRDEAGALVESIEADDLRGQLSVSDAMLAWAKGDLSQALVHAENAAPLCLAAGDVSAEAEACVIAAAVTAEFRVPRSAEICAKSLAVTESQGAHLLRALAQWANGLLRWQDGDLDGARDHLVKAIDLFRMFGRSYLTTMGLDGMACVAVSDQDYTTAATLLGGVDRIWQISGTTLPRAVHQRTTEQTEAKVRNALGEEAFETAFRRGATLSHDTLLDLAVGRKLGKPGGRGKASKQPDRLSKREREVAALVGNGLTNREIAERLVISQRTAETHVEHILVKLGFTSRSQIASWVTQETTAPEAG